MSIHHLIDSTSSEYLDFNRKQGKTKNQTFEKVATGDPPRTSNQSAAKLSSWSTSSTTLSPLTDTSYDSIVSEPRAVKIRSVNKAEVLNDNKASYPIDNTIDNTSHRTPIDGLNILRLDDDSVGKLLGSEDSEYSVIFNNEAALQSHQKSEKNNQSSSQPEVKYIYDHHTHTRLSKNEAVQTSGENIHHSKKELENLEYETPVSVDWCINPSEDPKMALISLLVETHRRIIGSREQPDLNLRNSVDYSLIWPFINPEESPENFKDKKGNRKYYFLGSNGQGYDWEDQNFSAPSSYLMERRKKLKDDVVMMKEELFYITENFLDLNKKYRHKIVKDSQLRKRFESVGLDLVYKRAHLDNMHHLYHKVKKLYEACLPLCHDT